MEPEGEPEAPIKRDSVEELSKIIAEFERLSAKSPADAENYVLKQESVIETVRTVIQKKQFVPLVFQWLYNCGIVQHGCKKLYQLVLQFVPDLIYLYLFSLSENYQQLKIATEAVLLGLMKSAGQEKAHVIHVPSLSRPSIYHQTASTIQQPSLTESNLQRHNFMQSSCARQTFGDKEITAANRLPFLAAVTTACTDNIALYPSSSLTALCHTSTRLVARGMHSKCISQLEGFSSQEGCVTMVELLALSKEKRFSLNDGLVSCLLQGVRMCIFKSSHHAAKQALHALKLRAEYELFPASLQVALALKRIAEEVSPLYLPLDPEVHKKYSQKDEVCWPSRPVTVVRSLMGQVLHHNLHPSWQHPLSPAGLHSQDEFEYTLDSSDSFAYSQETRSKFQVGGLPRFVVGDETDHTSEDLSPPFAAGVRQGDEEDYEEEEIVAPSQVSLKLITSKDLGFDNDDDEEVGAKETDVKLVRLDASPATSHKTLSSTVTDV